MQREVRRGERGDGGRRRRREPRDERQCYTRRSKRRLEGARGERWRAGVQEVKELSAKCRVFIIREGYTAASELFAAKGPPRFPATAQQLTFHTASGVLWYK